MKVIKFEQPAVDGSLLVVDKELVEDIKGLLGDVEKGIIVGVAIVAISENGNVATNYHRGPIGVFNMLGALAWLQQRFTVEQIEKVE